MSTMSAHYPNGLLELSREPERLTNLDALTIELPFPPAEVWRDVAGYEGRYQVSSLGRIRSLSRTEVMPYAGSTRVRSRAGRILAPRLTNQYLQTHLSREGCKEQPLIHRLVAQAFIANPEDKPQVNHIDGDKLNNVWTNLEWCTAVENEQHAINVLGIDKSGGRQLTCKGLIASNAHKTLAFQSIREAERAGFVRHMIKACLRGTYSQHRGYTWSMV